MKIVKYDTWLKILDAIPFRIHADVDLNLRDNSCWYRDGGVGTYMDLESLKKRIREVSISDYAENIICAFADEIATDEQIPVKQDTDPNGLAPSDPGAKLDAGKPMCGLLLDFGHALTEVAKVSTFGANKYSRGGWQHVDDGCNRYTDAMLRHLFSGNFNEVDEESGLLHAAQVAWNALARLELKLRKGDLV